MPVINATTYPQLHAAFKEIECDNGGHLIGTAYPGEAHDLEAFAVPDAWAPLLAPAEAALARLRATGEDDWNTFVVGEMSESEGIRERQGDLEEARRVLNDFFDGWPAEIP